jgi:hypothetical protein
MRLHFPRIVVVHSFPKFRARVVVSAVMMAMLSATISIGTSTWMESGSTISNE